MFDDIDPPIWRKGSGAKGAIGPCKANVELSRNLAVVLLVMGARLLHSVEE